MYDSLNNNHKIFLVLAFPKCGLPFLCRQYDRRYQDIHSQKAGLIVISKMLLLKLSRLKMQQITLKSKDDVQRNRVFATNTKFLIPISLQPDCIHFKYLKLIDQNLAELIV